MNKKYNLLHYLLIIFIINLFTIIIILLTNILTIISSSKDYSEPSFIKIPTNIQTKFIATENGLHRIDLLFKNNYLDSKDEYIINIYNTKGTLLVSKIVSGYNVGFSDYFRIDLPKIIQSKNNEYTIEIVVNQIIDNKLLLGVAKNNPQKFIINSYYKPPFILKDIINRTLLTYSRFIKTAWIQIIMILFLLAYLYFGQSLI